MDPYQYVDTGLPHTAVTARGFDPLRWTTRTIDKMARHALQRFFLAGTPARYMVLARGWRKDLHLYETDTWARDPGSFYPPAKAPTTAVGIKQLRSMRGSERLHVSFLSPYRTALRIYQPTFDAHRENATVHARVWRHLRDARPTVLCLHGWLGGQLRLEEEVFAAKQLFASGLNVVLVTLPLHGLRRPPGLFDADLFPSSDLRRTNEAFGQAVTDVRTTLAWIRQTGFATRLGLLGFSLGGYVSALVAGLEDNLDFVVPVMTPVSFGDVVWQLVAEHATRHADFDVSLLRRCLAIHCPLSHALRLPRSHVALVHGHTDGLVSPQQTHALWKHWGEPRLITFAGSHCLHLGRQAYISEVCAMMAGEKRPGATKASTHWLQGLAWDGKGTF